MSMDVNGDDYDKPFPASMLNFFLDEENEKEDNLNINDNLALKIENNLETNDLIDDLFNQLIKDKCTILMANSFNFQSFLQGRALSRISSSILKVLKHVYNHLEEKEENVSFCFKKLMHLFTTNEEKKDAKYTEDQILSLINRVILWKKKLNNKKIDDKSFVVETDIPTPIFRTFSNISSRIRKRALVLNIDEVSRLKKIRKRHLEVIKQFRPDSTIIQEDDDKEKTKDMINFKKEERLKSEAKRFSKDYEPVDDFLNWDTNEEQKNCNTKNNKQLSFPSSHRQELRQKISSYINLQPLEIKPRGKTTADLLKQTKKQKNFLTIANLNQCLKQTCTSQNIKNRCDELVSSHNNSISCVTTSNENKDLKNKSVIVASPNCKLKKCIKSYFSTNKKISRNVKFITKPTLIKYFEIEEENRIFYPAAEQSTITIYPSTKKFTKKLEYNSNQNDCFNLVNLPHQDAPAPLTKRSNPLLSGSSGLEDIYNNIENKIEKFYFHINKQVQDCVSRWIIADSLLCELNKKCLKNTYMTRLCYPNLPNWFISNGLNIFEKNIQFPREISCVFVECGYDIELLYSDEDTLIPFQFIHDLHNWFYKNAAFGEFKYIKPIKTQDGSIIQIQQITNRVMPIIVVINIPEIGDYKRLFQIYNNKVSQFINELNNTPEVKEFNEIKLLDWAGLVRSHPDQEKMLKNEERIRILIEEMRCNYGVLYK